jgi:hypothetical protein
VRSMPWVRTMGLAAALLLMGARHPMHTAVTEITRRSGASIMDVRIRLFADDFGPIAAGPLGSAATDTAMSRYVRGRFTVTDPAGRPIPLIWNSAKREGDVILLSLEAQTPGGLRGARVFSGLLAERFEDQINIVRITYDGRTTTLLFTPGDTPKVLP